MNKITTRTLPSMFHERSIGFDRMFDIFDEAIDQTATKYPPYNMIQLDENNFVVELALAGFQPEDLEIMQEGNKLKIVGRQWEDSKDADTEKTYLHKGISTRAFTREFVLAEHVNVRDNAQFKNGIMSIELEREVPEEMKPRQIKIK